MLGETKGMAIAGPFIHVIDLIMNTTTLDSRLSRKKKVMFYIKVVVTLGLSAFILAQADWAAIRSAVRSADLRLISGIFVCMIFNIAVSSWKWQALLVVHGISLRLSQLTKYYLTGLFFSNFLPSTIGGDGYRMYRIFTCRQSKAGAMMPVFFERLYGMVVLLFLGGLAGVVSYLQFSDEISRTGSLFGLGGTVCVLLLLGLGHNSRIQARIQSVAFLPARLKNAAGQMSLYHKKWRQVLKCIVITVFFYLLLFGYRFLMFQAVGETCPFFSLVLVTMLSTVIANLPVSINGIGLMDGSFIYLISTFGVTNEAALIVMLLHRTLTVAVSLIGGYFYLKDKGFLAEADRPLNAVNKLEESL